MVFFIFLLCAATSFLCAVLQWRAYLRAKNRFLLMMSLCFACFFANNLLLIIDSMTGPNVSLVIPRGLVLLTGLGVVLFGFIWEAI